MTMNSEREVIELEQGWAVMQKGIIKLKNLLEYRSSSSIPKNTSCFTRQFTICVHRSLRKITHNNFTTDTRSRLRSTLALREKHDEFMLRELVMRWDNHKIMVYAEMKTNVKDAVITLIDHEREGEQIDRALLKSVLVEIGMGNVDVYETDFEGFMLQDTAAYYSHKAASWIEEDSCPEYMLQAEECLKREKERVGHYLHASSEQKLLEKVQHELLTKYENHLLEKEDSGCDVLLRDDKVEDLSRMYRLFCRISRGLELVAAIFRQVASNPDSGDDANSGFAVWGTRNSLVIMKEFQ